MNNNTEIINYNKEILLEKSKEDFSSGLEKELFIFIAKLLKEKKIYTSSKIFNYGGIIRDNILNSLKSQNIDLSKIKKISLSKNGKLKIITAKNTLNFNLNIDYEKLKKNPELNLFLGDKKQIEQEKQKQNLDIVKTREKTSNILDAMDYIFTKNEKEFFGEINDEDIVDTDFFGKELKGKNLKQLQKLFKQNFDKLNNYPKENLTKEHIKDLFYQERRYFIMTMGIGDKYEGGASYLKETESNFDKLTNDLVNFAGTNTQLLDQLEFFHSEIDDNDYQSTTVEKSYQATIKTLHYKIYNKLMKDKKTTEKELIRFAKIVTGRDSDIDDNLRDPALAEKVLIAVMQKKGGVFEKLTNNVADDPEIMDKNPKSIIDNTRNKFYKKYGKNLQFQKLFNKNLKAAGYDDILNISKDKKYSDLNFYQKNKLSVLYRVSKKMEEGKTNWDMIKESGAKALMLENPLVKQKYILQDFSGLFNLVAKDYIEEVSDKLDDEFTSFWGLYGKDAEDFGLTGVQAEAFEIFQDIRGAGLFDLSDETWEGIKTGSKFAGTIMIAMLAPAIILPTSAGLIAQGAVAGAAASIGGWALNPHGYDTKEEAILDITSDLAIGTITGAAGGKLAKIADGYKGNNNFFKFIRNDKVIMAEDLIFLGLGPEIKRQKWINGKFHNEKLLEE